MMLKGMVIFMLTIGGVVISIPSMANTMRCGNLLIETGDSKVKVLTRCGEPLLKEIISGSVGSSSPKIEEWTYDMGPGQFLRILTFKGSTLIKIELGDKL